MLGRWWPTGLQGGRECDRIKKQEEHVWTYVVCVWVSEGQMNISGVPGTGRSGSPRWGALATATGTPTPARLWRGKHTIL